MSKNSCFFCEDSWLILRLIPNLFIRKHHLIVYRYEWKQNGVQLNTRQPNNIGKGPDGTIRIDRATETDEGYYQCYATNQYGTALSNMIHVRMAFLNSATGSPTVSRKSVVQGRPFHIQADRERSFPQPSYEWYSAYDVDAIHTLLWPTARIQFAKNGNAGLSLISIFVVA